MQKKGAPLGVKILMIVVLFCAVVKIIDLNTRIAEKKDQLETLDMRVEEYETFNEALSKEMKDEITDEDISEIARTELGYATPGERVFVDTSSR